MGEVKANGVFLAADGQTNPERISVGKVGGIEYFAQVTLHNEAGAMVYVGNLAGSETKTIYPGRNKEMLGAITVEHGS